MLINIFINSIQVNNEKFIKWCAKNRIGKAEGRRIIKSDINTIINNHLKNNNLK